MDALIPTTLETARLLLRPFRQDDWRALHEHYGDPDCTRFTFGRPQSEAGSWRAMASMAGHWLLHGFGPYATVEKASGEVLGAVGLWFPVDWPEREIKWALRRRAWGQGFASEAARAVQAAACQHLPGPPPISLINAANTASIRLAQAVGATLEREVSFREEPWQIYRHPAR